MKIFIAHSSDPPYSVEFSIVGFYATLKSVKKALGIDREHPPTSGVWIETVEVEP